MISLFLSMCLHASPAAVSHVGYRSGQAVTVDLRPIPGVDNDGKQLYLERRAAQAWMDLLEAATKAGHHLKPTYAYRTRDQQLKLRKQSRRLAAKVGHSPHQEGLAIDVVGMTRRYPPDLRKWMRREAPKYGFKQAKREPWHFEFDSSLLPVDKSPTAR